MQLFRPGANTIATLVIAAIGAAPVLAVGLSYELMRSPYVTDQNVTRNQPVPFSHEHHVVRARTRLPLLPHLGREGALRRRSADGNLHDLPFADLDQRADARAGAGKSRQEPADCTGSASTGFPTTSISIIRSISPKASAAPPATATSGRCG